MYSALQKKYAYELHLFALLNRSQIDFICLFALVKVLLDITLFIFLTINVS